MNWSFIQRILLKAEHRSDACGQRLLKQQKALKPDKALKSHPRFIFGQQRKGSAMMICVLLLGLFLTLGVGVLLNSQIFLQVQGFRKLNTLSSYAAENGIKEALEKTKARAEELYSGLEIDEELFADIKRQLETGKPELIEPLRANSVLTQKEEFSGMSWETIATGQLSSFFALEQYLKATFELTIKSTGQMQGFSGKRSQELLLGLTFYAGHLPLNQLPLAVEDGGLKEAERDQVKIIQNKTNLAQARLFFLKNSFIPEDALPLISRGLKILKPDRLPNWLLRQALGLEPNNEPIPDGVYLVKHDLGLGGVYVQGDLDELLLGIENDFQLIQFRQEDRGWLLKFNPAKGETFFMTPETSESFESLPVPIIMVNGQINSLATGKINQEGYLILIDDRQTPAVLSGLKLAIVCSRKINLTSDLISEGLEWKDGIPDVRSQQSQLIIWSTGKDFQSEELVDGGINLLSGSNKDWMITANLIAGGQGLQITVPAGEVNLVGSLAAIKINPGQNHLTINHQVEAPTSGTESSDFQVYSEKALLHLSEFKILEWRPGR